MKNEDRIIDWRSTGRRKARRVLYESYVTYECAECGVTPIVPPKDAPEHFEEIWPLQEKLQQLKTIASQLQANHITKDLTINEVGYVEWLCPRCHKLKDSQTGVGVSTVEETIIY